MPNSIYHIFSRSLRRLKVQPEIKIISWGTKSTDWHSKSLQHLQVQSIKSNYLSYMVVRFQSTSGEI